jgi:serine/threonine protein phosphatase PrpC
VMLCTDGLTNMLTDESIAEIIQKSGNPEDACRNLVSQANARGGKDNITVLIAENTD